MIFLAGDIGGTHTRLLLGEAQDQGWRTLAHADYPSDQFDTFDAVLHLFLETEPYQPETMVLAVAGPVIAQRVAVTNLPWVLDAVRLAARFGIPGVQLLNDFEAQGYALSQLKPDELHTLQAGEPDLHGTRALLGAGTGLGMAIVNRCGTDWQVLPGEGGHTGFAPRNETELALWQSLRKQLGRVSNETILSGPGLQRLYQHVCRELGVAPVHQEPVAISQAALEGHDAPAEATLDRFASIYGAVAGDLALLCLARGGVYLGGGIAPKIIPLLERGGFLAAFCDKTPLRELLETIPVHVIMAERTGLIGAVTRALQILQAG